MIAFGMCTYAQNSIKIPAGKKHPYNAYLGDLQQQPSHATSIGNCK